MFNSYKVAVELTLVNGISSALNAISGQFNSLNNTVGKTRVHLTEIEKQIASIKRTAAIGGAVGGAGIFGLSLLHGPVEAATEYEKAYSRFKQFNLGDLANKQAEQFARATQVFGASSADLMDALNMSMGVFGREEMGMAYKVAPIVAQLNAANAGIFGGKVEGIESGAFRAVNRFIDMKGLAGSYEDYMHGLDLAQKIVSGSGGTIQFRDLEQFAKRGGTAFKSLSDEGVFNMMLAMQEMGGSTAGQSMMSLYQNLVAGRASKKAINALAGLGLVDTSMMTAGQLGGDQFQTLETKSVIDAKMASTDPMGWMRKYVLPKLAGMSQDQQFQIVNSLFSNRNASNLGSLGVSQVMQVLRDAEMGRGAMGVQQTLANGQNNPANQFIELQKKWNSLLTELGIAILPSVIKATQGLITVIRVLKDLPGPVKTGLMSMFTVLSVAAAAGGTITLATAGFKALNLALAFGMQGGILGQATKAFSAMGVALGPVALGSVAIIAAFTAMQSFFNFVQGKDASNFISKWAGVDDWNFGGKGDGMVTTTDGRRIPIAQYNKEHGFDIESIRARRSGGVAPHSHPIIMDGKQVAEGVTHHQVNAASRPSGGTSQFDPNRMAPPSAVPVY